MSLHILLSSLGTVLQVEVGRCEHLSTRADLHLPVRKAATQLVINPALIYTEVVVRDE